MWSLGSFNSSCFWQEQKTLFLLHAHLDMVQMATSEKKAAPPPGSPSCSRAAQEMQETPQAEES